MPPSVRTATDALDPARLAGWRHSWDRVMSGFVPGMASLERLIGVGVDALRGRAPDRILDLGGGPGVLAETLGARWPDARATLVDIDPVLLALARAALPEDLLTVVDADLTSPDWPDLVGGGFDLVTAVMTVHYLTAAQVLAFYRDARRVLAPGGVLVVADVMPDDGLPALMRGLDPGPAEAAAELAWAQWWSGVAEVAEFRPLLAARTDIFGSRPAAGFTAGASWHVGAARAAGFAEVGVMWREGRHAALAAM